MIVSDEKNSKSGLLFIGQLPDQPTDTAEPILWFRPLYLRVPPEALTESCTRYTKSNTIFSRSHKVNFEILSMNLYKIKHVSYTHVSLKGHV